MANKPDHYDGSDIQVLEGLGGRSASVRACTHRLDVLAATHPGVRGRRQRRRRSARRILRRDQGVDPSGQLDLGRRQRARYPDRQAPEREDPHRRGGAHHPARRRQVRRRGLQGVRRPARRGRLRRERAVFPRGSAGAQGGQGVLHRLRPRQDVREAARSWPHEARQRHDRVVLARPGDLHRDHRVRFRHSGEPLPRDGVPQQGPQDRAVRRARHRCRRQAAHRGVPVRRRHRRLREVPERGQGNAEQTITSEASRTTDGTVEGAPYSGHLMLHELRHGVREQHQHARRRARTSTASRNNHAYHQRVRAPAGISKRRIQPPPATTRARAARPSCP